MAVGAYKRYNIPIKIYNLKQYGDMTRIALKSGISHRNISFAFKNGCATIIIHDALINYYGNI
jgi:hypothetical protein